MEDQKSSKAIKNIDINWELPLPTHMAPLIFSHLSISDFPVCRCVCKSWNHLVLDYARNSFSKLHPPNSIILSTCDRISNNPLELLNPKIHCFDIPTLSFVASHSLVEPDISFVFVHSCCNGLLYLFKGYKTIGCVGIFNPMTREFFKLPFSDDLRGLHHGFGFSTKTKQYKIFLAYPKTTCEWKVLRLGSNQYHNYQWASIKQPFPVSVKSHGVYMNGVIYWIGIENKNRNVNNIYALDVETEKIEVVMVSELPCFRGGNLQLFNGTIYLIIHLAKPMYQIQLWKMQSKHSWIKDFIIPSKAKILPHLLKAFEDGKILVRITKSLFWLKHGKKIEKKDEIKELIPHNKPIAFHYIWVIDSLHFGSISSILAGDN